MALALSLTGCWLSEAIPCRTRTSVSLLHEMGEGSCLPCHAQGWSKVPVRGWGGRTQGDASALLLCVILLDPSGVPGDEPLGMCAWRGRRLGEGRCQESWLLHRGQPCPVVGESGRSQQTQALVWVYVCVRVVHGGPPHPNSMNCHPSHRQRGRGQVPGASSPLRCSCGSRCGLGGGWGGEERG